MNHVLSIDVIDTLNPTIFRLSDASVYNVNMPVECAVLQITPPGYQESVSFENIREQPFLNLTACDLEIQTTDCGRNFANLPDGIYVIRYSVAPREIVYVEYNHLRVTNLMNRYLKILCSVNLNACEPNEDVENKLKVLREIKAYIDAAKAKAEICQEPKKSIELYSYAKKLLSKFDCKNC